MFFFYCAGRKQGWILRRTISHRKVFLCPQKEKWAFFWTFPFFQRYWTTQNFGLGEEVWYRTVLWRRRPSWTKSITWRTRLIICFICKACREGCYLLLPWIVNITIQANFTRISMESSEQPAPHHFALTGWFSVRGLFLSLSSEYDSQSHNFKNFNFCDVTLVFFLNSMLQQSSAVLHSFHDP